jgi:hypothetical protein
VPSSARPRSGNQLALEARLHRVLQIPLVFLCPTPSVVPCSADPPACASPSIKDILVFTWTRAFISGPPAQVLFPISDGILCP